VESLAGIAHTTAAMEHPTQNALPVKPSPVSQQELGRYDLGIRWASAAAQQVPKGLLLNHAVTPSGRQRRVRSRLELPDGFVFREPDRALEGDITVSNSPGKRMGRQGAFQWLTRVTMQVRGASTRR